MRNIRGIGKIGLLGIGLSLLKGHGEAPKTKTAPTVQASQSCDLEKMENALDGIGLSESLELVLAAGPNQTYNAPAAQKLLTAIGNVHSDISLTILVDGDSWDSWRKPPFIDDLPGNVAVNKLAQNRGTSYTEVVDSVDRTDAQHLVLFAHNKPLQWRIDLAARNAIDAGTYQNGLESVRVLCHDGSNTSMGNTLKEVGSYTADLVGGHDFTMETSIGGYRKKRAIEWIANLHK